MCSLWTTITLSVLFRPLLLDSPALTVNWPVNERQRTRNMELALIPASRKSSRWNNDKHVGDGRELEDRLVQTYHKANSRPRSILFVDSRPPEGTVPRPWHSLCFRCGRTRNVGVCVISVDPAFRVLVRDAAWERAKERDPLIETPCG